MEIGESFVGSGAERRPRQHRARRPRRARSAWRGRPRWPRRRPGTRRSSPCSSRACRSSRSRCSSTRPRIEGDDARPHHLGSGPGRRRRRAWPTPSPPGSSATRRPSSLVLIAAVWVDPEADDADAVFANNREATRSAIVIGQAGLPVAADAVAKRGEAWNPYYRAPVAEPPPAPPEPEPAPTEPSGRRPRSPGRSCSVSRRSNRVGVAGGEAPGTAAGPRRSRRCRPARSGRSGTARPSRPGLAGSSPHRSA